MSRILATLLMLTLHGAAWAGPVPADGADAAPAAGTLPSVSSQAASDVTPADAAASNPAGSTLALEIIKEAEAGAAAAETPRSPRRDSSHALAAPQAPTPNVRNQPRADDDPWGLRDMGKAAVQWVKEAVPWLRSDEDARQADQTATPDAADWSASALEGGQTGSGTRFGANPAHHAAAANPLSTVGYGDPARPKAPAADENIMRVVMNAIREVLEHPMTWLVVSLIVVGRIAMKRADRRPK